MGSLLLLAVGYLVPSDQLGEGYNLRSTARLYRPGKIGTASDKLVKYFCLLSQFQNCGAADFALLEQD